MPEPEGSSEPAENRQEDIDKEASHRARKLLATSAALTAAATLAVTANQPNRSARPEAKSAIATDVSFNQYGKDGHPAPQIIMQKSQDGGIEKVKVVPSDNPYELAQQALYVAAKEPTANRIAYGMDIVVKPGTVFLHKLDGSSTFTPANPIDNGEAGKYVVPADEVAIIENPRFIVTSVNDEPDQPVYIAATLAGNSNTTNRATDINQVFFISVPQVYKDIYNGKDGFLSLNGSPVPLGEPSVDYGGNLKFGSLSADKLSVIRTSKIISFEQQNAKEGLKPTTPTAGR